MAKRNNRQLNPEKGSPEQMEVDEVERKILSYYQGNSTDSGLGESVAHLSKSLGIKDYKVAKKIYALHEASSIKLSDSKPPLTLISYFMSLYSLWFWALIGLVCSTIITVYLGAGPIVYLRYILGSLFIFYFPGFSLIQLLYPKKNRISQLERIVLSIGVSLALVSIMMIILNYTPWGIRLDPIVALLCLLTVGFAIGGVVRKFSKWS